MSNGINTGLSAIGNAAAAMSGGGPVSAHGLADELEHGSRPAAPYTVDTSKGAVRGDVAAQWASRPADQRFDTLSDLYKFTKAKWDRARDVHLRSAELNAYHPTLDFSAEGMSEAQESAEVRRRMGLLTVGYKDPHGGDVQSIVEAAPTNHAFAQLCSYADVRTSEVRKFPTSIACQMLNWQLRYGGARSQDVKLWADREGHDRQVHAVQGPQYGRIADHEIVAALMTIAGDGKGEDPAFHWKAPGRLNWGDGTYDPEDIGPESDRTFYASDRDMFSFLVDDRRPIVVGKTRDGHDDHMFRGFYVHNSMVGSRTLKVAVFYLRGVCMNRNLWGVENFDEVTVRHTKGAPERWLNEARPALESFAKGSDRNLIDGVARAKAKVIADDEKHAIKFLRDSLSFSDAAARSIMDIGEREEGVRPRTVWDFGQAITAHARVAHNSDSRLEIELKAKSVFDRITPAM